MASGIWSGQRGTELIQQSLELHIPVGNLRAPCLSVLSLSLHQMLLLLSLLLKNKD